MYVYVVCLCVYVYSYIYEHVSGQMYMYIISCRGQRLILHVFFNHIPPYILRLTSSTSPP